MISNKRNLDRHTEIIEKAGKIFKRHGYRKTTIEDIAKACGLGKTALYHYFPSKEAIFVEVVRVESAEMLRKVSQSVDAVSDPREKLLALTKTRLKVISEIMAEITEKKTGEEIIGLLPSVARVRQQFFDKEANLLQSILEEGQRQGVFKSFSSNYVPVLMIAAIRGVELHCAQLQPAPSLNTAINLMMKLFFEGICV